jgi:hypothetical protein
MNRPGQRSFTTGGRMKFRSTKSSASRSEASQLTAAGPPRRGCEILLPLSFRWQPNIATTQKSTLSPDHDVEHFPPRFGTPQIALTIFHAMDDQLEQLKKTH